MQLAVHKDDLPEAVKNRLIGKKDLTPDGDGFFVVDAKRLLIAAEKAPKGRGHKKTHFVLGREGTHGDSPVAKIYAVDVENIESEHISTYVDYFKRIAAKVKRDIFIHNSHNTPSMPMQDGRRMHIFPFSAPGNVDLLKSEYFSGEQLGDDMPVDFISPTFLGEVYGDDEGVAIAEWNGNSLHVLWDFQHLPFVEQSGKFLDKIFDGSLKKIENTVVDDVEGLKKDLRKVIDRDFSSYVKQRDQHRDRARDLESQLVVEHKELVTLNTMLGNVDKAKADKVETAIQEISEIGTLKGVCRVKFREGTLTIYTYPVVVENRNLGAFKIHIHHDRVTFEAIDGNMNACHPHIQSDGGACLGNIRNSVVKMIARKEYLGLASFLLEFLHTWNDGDAYRKLKECGKKYEGETEGAGEVVDPLSPDDGILFGDLMTLEELDSSSEEKEEEDGQEEGPEEDVPEEG